MQILAIFLLALVVVLWALRQASRLPPAKLVRMVKTGSGLLALGGAALLLVRGRWDMGLGLGGLGLWLVGMGEAPAWTKAFRKPGAIRPGVSRLRSAMIEMEFDAGTGVVEGVILAGMFEGNRLADLNQAQCSILYRTCLADDPDGARLLEAYFDRRFPGWRPAGDGQSDARSRNRQSAFANAMSENEAYEILGLQKGATREDVARAHRSLMKKLHPDHGGSTSLAARVNEAKYVLMRRQK